MKYFFVTVQAMMVPDDLDEDPKTMEIFTTIVRTSDNPDHERGIFSSVLDYIIHMDDFFRQEIKHMPLMVMEISKADADRYPMPTRWRSYFEGV